MKPSQGYVHSVETFGTVDGPGTRYVLFLSGCTLGCCFCHNRDTWQLGGKPLSVAAVLADYELYRVFYESSGGGLTVSGGEPLLQPDFVAELFRACRERGIHTALDTAGHCAPAALQQVLPHADLVMFSVKAGTDATYRRLTGRGSQQILENLKQAAAAAPLVVRYVIIPGITDTAEELNALADLVNRLPGGPAVELLGYHQAGRKKWDELKVAYPLADTPSATGTDIEQAARLLHQRQVVLLGY